VIERMEHLAITAPNWVGDLVMATPVFEAALKAAHIGRVSVLVRAHLAPLLADGPIAPHVREHQNAGDECAALRELAPDAVMLLSNSFGAAWRAFRARVPIRAGSALSSRRFLLTHAVVPPMRDGRRFPIPTAHLHRDVAGLLGVLVDNLHPRLYVRNEVREQQRALLSERGIAGGEPYVVCCPGAAFGSAKLWPPDRFARVLDDLHAERGWHAVVTGGPGEEPLVGEVARFSRGGVISLADTHGNLESLKALIASARLLLVGDSGPRWIAAAFDVPCVSIMGPNVPELTASSLELAEIVRLDLDCSPCAQRVCPLGHHRCMTDLEPERVVAAARRVLAIRPA
jgi:lipopolysaccharide heptosyltransferase II